MITQSTWHLLLNKKKGYEREKRTGKSQSNLLNRCADQPRSTLSEHASHNSMTQPKNTLSSLDPATEPKNSRGRVSASKKLIFGTKHILQIKEWHNSAAGPGTREELLPAPLAAADWMRVRPTKTPLLPPELAVVVYTCVSFHQGSEPRATLAPTDSARTRARAQVEEAMAQSSSPSPLLGLPLPAPRSICSQMSREHGEEWI
jgi:hypothetical protein